MNLPRWMNPMPRRSQAENEADAWAEWQSIARVVARQYPELLRGYEPDQHATAAEIKAQAASLREAWHDLQGIR